LRLGALTGLELFALPRLLNLRRGHDQTVDRSLPIHADEEPDRSILPDGASTSRGLRPERHVASNARLACTLQEGRAFDGRDRYRDLRRHQRRSRIATAGGDREQRERGERVFAGHSEPTGQL
jgi:hypothetical protein